MKSGQAIETAQRALEVLLDLMQKNMDVDEILDFLASKQEYSSVYTREAIYKYFNTFKVLGIELEKEKGKYYIRKGASSIPLNQQDILTLNLIENYIEASPQTEFKNNFSHIKELLEKNNVNLSDKIFVLDSENIIKANKKYQKYSDLIKQLEKYCIDKQKIKMLYKNNQGITIEYKIVADELIFDKGFLLLKAYCTESCDIAHFIVEQILNVEILPQRFTSSFFVKTTVFKISGNLVKNYKLKTGETLQEQGEDYMIISNNYQNYDEISRRLFRYGENCEILYPKELRKQMREKIEKSLKLHDN